MFLAPNVFAGEIIANAFGGLDTQDSPASLQPYQAQSLLNVNLQPRMAAVYKRDGYGSFQTLTYSTAAVHGGYHFQQTSGSDVQLWGSDVNLSSIVSDAASVTIATGTKNATWQCTDNLGFAYCATSSNDTMVKTDGTSGNTSYMPGSAPLGTMVTSTPFQLVAAGVAANLSTIYFSANNNFSNFATGPLSTDSYTEIINAPGSRITHIAYYFGKLFWWKDQSFGYLSNSGSQYTVTITIVSNQIGTLDNSSAFWNPTVYEGPNAFGTGTQTASQGNTSFNETPSLGGIFFRGQDNHIYQYDGYTLTRLTRIIEPTITSANRRKSNSWTQTTQADFNAGVSTPSANLSTSISVGDVITSSYTQTDNSSTQWNSGTNTNMSINASSITLATNNSGNITDNGFEDATIADHWTTAGSFSSAASYAGICTINPDTGSRFGSATTNNTCNLFEALVLSYPDGAVIGETDIPFSSNNCTWNSNNLLVGSNIGRRVQVKLVACTVSAITNDSYILGGNLTFQFASATPVACPGGICNHIFAIDSILNGSSTISTGQFTSQIYNTGLSSPTYQISAFSYVVNSSTPTFDLQTATATSAGVNWQEILTSTTTSAFGYQYFKYTTTETVTSAGNALGGITGVTVIAQSSGTYTSAVKNAPLLTTFGNFAVTDNTPGNSAISYNTRSSANFFSVGSSTPAWVAQTKNAEVAAAANAWFQAQAIFTVTGATETPKLSDFTFNWFEGTASDKSYIIYFKDAIWISESSGTATSTDDVVYYLDLINNAWLQYNIAANGFLVENNNLYFGDPLAGKIYKYGSVTTDNGVAINSYWQSKDFTGDNPTVQNEFQQADFIFSEGLSTATYTYTLDQNTATAVSIPLYNSASSIIKRGFLLAAGKIGTFYNFKISDNSSNAPWKLLMHKVKYNPLNWIPQTR